MRNPRDQLIATYLTSGSLAAILWLASCTGSAPPNEVTVVGVDYAFAAPDSLSSGPTAIAFENRGEVRHEMILVRLKEGVTLAEVLEAAQGGGDPEDYTEGGPGILIAGPGQTAASRLLVDLLPGRTYALVCNFRDEPDAPPHTALGMTASFRVVDRSD